MLSTIEEGNECISIIHQRKQAMASNSNTFIGRTLGNCTLERLIGQGGMGAVYLAQQARPSRYVAVKVLFPRGVIDNKTYNEFLTRFRREADLIARLEHINIVPIYEYGEQDGLAYLVMPNLTGGSLRNVLRSEERRVGKEYRSREAH